MMHLEVRARGSDGPSIQQRRMLAKAGQTNRSTRRATPLINRQKERTTPSLVDCFNCGKKGHFAAQCPDRQVRINKISTSNSIMVSGKIGNKETSMMLDSGAAMSLFPAKLINQKDYTGGWLTVRGAVGEQSLQTAVVNVEMEGKKEDMCVLVTTEDTTPLLGMDHPHFDDILLNELTKKRAKWEHDSSPPPQQSETLLEDTDFDKEDYGGSSPVDEERGGLEEEEVLGGDVFAVQTRRQQERERQQQQQDDEASAASGAVPLDLATLDDSLFGSTKEAH